MEKDKLALFLKDLKEKKRYSPHTIENYKRDLSQFLEFIKKETLTLENFEYQHARKYILYLKKKEYKETSIHRHISALKSFFNALKKNKERENNPFKEITLPKKPSHLPQTLTESEMEAFLNHLPKETALDLRNKAICELLYSTGLRISELTSLNKNTIELNQNFLKVKGKGKTERLVIFGAPCKKALIDYLNNGRPLHENNTSEALFLNTKGQRLTQRSIQRILHDLAIKSGITKNITPHTLRHSFATDLYNGGANLRVIQELLGHKNIVTTQIYTHISNKKLKSAYEKALPLGEEIQK